MANRASVRVADLRHETFLVAPRELAPSAFAGLQTMCRTYGGFEPDVLERSTIGADWRPVIAGQAVALVAEASAEVLRPEGTVALTVEPPPGYSLAIAWRHANGSSLLHRFLDFVRAYRDEHRWAD